MALTLRGTGSANGLFVPSISNLEDAPTVVPEFVFEAVAPEREKLGNRGDSHAAQNRHRLRSDLRKAVG